MTFREWGPEPLNCILRDCPDVVCLPYSLTSTFVIAASGTATADEALRAQHRSFMILSLISLITMLHCATLHHSRNPMV